VTLRGRVLAYLALAAIASCALTVAVAALLVRHRIVQQQTTALQTQADELAALGADPGDHVYAVASGHAHRLGPRRARAVLSAIPASSETEGTVQVLGRSLRYVVRPTGDGRVVLVRPAALAFADWRPFLASLGLAGAGGAVLAALLSYLLARRLTRPIADLSHATQRVARGEPGVEVTVHGDDELAELGESFNHMSSELSRARAAQRQFLESVTHELKTPLTSIRGYAEALEENAIGPDDAARVIGAEADRLERLVSDLLDLARLEREGFAVAREPVDLAMVARQAVERHLPRARELSVELTCGAANDAWALGDGERILQAVSNLIENALRITPAGGSVAVAASAGRIAVSDTGPGLAPKDIPHAFERFYLYRQYGSERAVGTGLGLAIVKELAAAMGGEVQVIARPGEGAEFVIRLPTPARSALPDAARPSA
jgi:signal transduction histidine kinase